MSTNPQSQYIPTSQQSTNMENPNAEEIFAGQFENVAKMSRLAPSATAESTDNWIPQVKLRPVIYRPDHNTAYDNHQDSDSRSDMSGTRPGSANHRIFHKRFTGEPEISNLTAREKWRNKQRQRELKDYERNHALDIQKYEDYPKENRRRQVRRTINQRNQQLLYNGTQRMMTDPYSDMDIRNNPNRSGYSTPGGSADERRLGRSMRAAPRHGGAPSKGGDGRNSSSKNEKLSSENDCVIEPLLARDTNSDADAVSIYFHSTLCQQPQHRSWSVLNRAANQSLQSNAVGSLSSPQHPTQDFIEMLNKQQHLKLQQQEQRQRYLEEQKLKQKAQQLVNQTLLHSEIKKQYGSTPSQLLSDAFLLTGSNGMRPDAGTGRSSRSGHRTPQQQFESKPDRSGTVTPDTVVDESPWTATEQSAQVNDNLDFFDDNKKADEKQDEEVQEKEDTLRAEEKYMQAIQDEMQRLQPSGN